MAYRADIEIGVKGAAYLEQLQNKLTQVSRAIDTLNAKEVVVRRTIAGAAYATPAGPGGSGVTRASAVAASAAVERQVAQVRRTEAQAELKIVKDRGIAENYISGVINRRLAAKAKELELERQQTAEVQKRAASERRKRAENVIIGGAFPMLFGAGPGAVLGGAAGGLIPGNPMLSVATSALGAVLDEFGAKTTELGKTLQDPIANFETLKEASLLASSNQERYIQKLIESGKVAEAQAAIQAELFKKVSTQGVADLQNLGAASSKLSRAWAEFNLQLQTALAGPMAGLLSWLAGVVNIGNSVTREAAQQSNISQGLSGADRAALQREEARILQGANIFNEAQKREQVSQLYSSYQSRAGAVPTGAGMSAASQETVQLEKAKTAELQAQVNLATKQLSLSGVDININRDLYAARSKQVALQEYENKLLEIKNSFIGKAFDAERNILMIREANLNYAAKVRNIDTQVQEATNRAAKEAEDARKKNYLEQLDLVLQINDARGEFRKIQTDMVAYQKGESEALRVQAGFIKDELNTKLTALKIQKDKALLNTTDIYNTGLINTLYEQQVKNAEQLATLEQNKTVALANQLDLQEKLTTFSEERTRGQQLRGLQTQSQKTLIGITNPFGGPEAENAALALDQQVRSAEILGAQADKITDLTEKLNVAKTNYQEGDIERYTQQIALEQAHQTQLTEQLAILDQLEQKQLQQNLLMKQYGNLVANELATAMSSAVTAVITGTGTVQEAFANMFQNIGKAFVDMAAQMLAQQAVLSIFKLLGLGASAAGGFSFTGGGPASGASVFGSGQAAFNPLAFTGGLGFRAGGGSVSSSRSYVVGEKGPELFVPGTGGSVVSNNDLRSAMGSAPGAAGSPVLNMSFQSTNIGGVEYVSRDQLEAAMAATRRDASRDGARRGMSMTLDKLQQSPGTRSRVGLR